MRKRVRAFELKEEFDLDQIRAYRKTPVKEKFRFMEEASAFFRKTMTPKAKRVSELLVEKGW